MDYNEKYLPLAIVAGVLLVTSITTTFLRCYVRKSIVKLFGADDWLILVSLFIFVGYIATVFLGGTFGIGLHESQLSNNDRVQAYKIWWICYVVYGICITITRISISLFFLRITVHKAHRYTIYFTIGWNVISGVIYFFVVIFQCYPASYYWARKDNTLSMDGNCMPTDVFVKLAYLYGASCAFCDLIFVALPAVLVWNLDISWRRKLALAPILGMTGFAGCCPLVRMAYLHNLASPDYLYDTIDIAIWSVLESGVAITACSLATLRPLFRAMHEQISSFGRSYALRSLPERDFQNIDSVRGFTSEGDGLRGGFPREKKSPMKGEDDSPNGEFVFFGEPDVERGGSRTGSEGGVQGINVHMAGDKNGEKGNSWLVLDRRREVGTTP